MGAWLGYRPPASHTAVIFAVVALVGLCLGLLHDRSSGLPAVLKLPASFLSAAANGALVPRGGGTAAYAGIATNPAAGGIVHHYGWPFAGGVLHIFVRVLKSNQGFVTKFFLFHETEARSEAVAMPASYYPHPAGIRKELLSLSAELVTSSGVRVLNHEAWECLQGEECVAKWNPYGKFRLPVYTAVFGERRNVSLRFSMPNRTMVAEAGRKLTPIERRIPLDAMINNAQDVQARKKGIRAVVSTTYGIGEDPKLAAKLLSTFVSFHKRVGVEAVDLYCRAHVCQQFHTEPTIAALVADGSLSLITWEVFPQTPQWVYFSQAVQFNHAILSHLSSAHYLLMMDLDEFVAVDHKAELLSLKCILTLLKNGCATFQKFNFYATKQVPLGEFNLSRLQLRDTTPAPLTSGKNIVNPNVVYGFFVHDVKVCEKYSINGCLKGTVCPQINASCATMAHAINMFKERRKLPESLEKVDDWLWPLKG